MVMRISEENSGKLNKDLRVVEKPMQMWTNMIVE